MSNYNGRGCTTSEASSIVCRTVTLEQEHAPHLCRHVATALYVGPQKDNKNLRRLCLTFCPMSSPVSKKFAPMSLASTSPSSRRVALTPARRRFLQPSAVTCEAGGSGCRGRARKRSNPQVSPTQCNASQPIT